MSEVSGAVMSEVMAGFPSVRVPVLSTTRSLTRESFSREEGLRMRTPRRAARERPQAVATGAARPRAQGQAAMRTATARLSAVAVVSPARIHPAAVARARRRTSGVKRAAILSARRWKGGGFCLASSTSWERRATRDWLPAFSARMRSRPPDRRVPPRTESPGNFSTGRGSPVRMDSSTEAWPSRIFPSAGIV